MSYIIIYIEFNLYFKLMIQYKGEDSVKKIILVALMSVLCICPIQLWAKTTATLVEGTQYIHIDDKWEDTYEAPSVLIDIQDAYKRKGQVERIQFSIDGGRWLYNGSMSSPFECRNIDKRDIAIQAIGEQIFGFDVTIPNDLQEGENVSFKVPLLLEVMAADVRLTIKPGADAELIEEETLLIGTTSDKKVTWRIDEVPEIVGQGNMATIDFTEVVKNALSEKEFRVTFIIENSQYGFGEFTYESKEEYADNTVYMVPTNKYLEYGGGFKGIANTFKVIVPKGTRQKVEVVIKGEVASSIGKIKLKNMPVVNLNTTYSEQALFMSIQGMDVVDNKQHVKVAEIVLKSKEQIETEKQAEEKAKQEAEKQAEVLAEAQRGAHFKVGTSYYTVDGEKFEMDGETFIQAPGYIMVPLKYVAAALDIDEEDVRYAGGSIFINYNYRNIELRPGSDIAIVNKASIKLTTPVVIKDGRSYAPISEVAKLLGIKKQWDAENKVAIFKR